MFGDSAKAMTPMPDVTTPFTGINFWEEFGISEFITAPKPGRSFSMIVIGDNQALPYDHERVVQTIVDNPADLLIHTGDIIHNGLINQFRQVYLLMQTPAIRRIPHFHVSGNHEGHGETIPFDTIFPMPNNRPVMIEGEEVLPSRRVGFLDYGHLRIFALDSEQSIGEGSPQLAWLDEGLGRTVREHPEITLLFVSWHRPTYSWSESTKREWKEALHEVLTCWRVDMVWTGHNHCYERFEQDGITYIVTGGAGAFLTNIDGNDPDPGDNRLAAESSFHIVRGEIDSEGGRFTAIRAEDGGEIDRFTITVRDRSDLE